MNSGSGDRSTEFLYHLLKLFGKKADRLSHTVSLAQSSFCLFLCSESNPVQTWRLVHCTDWDEVVHLRVFPASLFSFIHSISLENKKYLNLQSGLWFTGLIETGYSVLHQKERETWELRMRGRVEEKVGYQVVRKSEGEHDLKDFSWQLQSCESDSSLRWSCSKNEGWGILSRYTDISNYHQFFHFNGPVVLHFYMSIQKYRAATRTRG